MKSLSLKVKGSSLQNNALTKLSTTALCIAQAYELLSIELVTSTVVAFLIAVVVSYLINYRFTFRSQKQHKSSLPKFIVTVLVGLGWNIGITVLVVQYLGGPLLLAVLAAASVIMINNYLLSKFWVF